MSLMPEQEFECPSCHDRRKTRIVRPLCFERKCNYCDLVPVMSPSPFETDVEPKMGKPTAVFIAIVSFVITTLFVIYKAIQEIFP